MVNQKPLLLRLFTTLAVVIFLYAWPARVAAHNIPNDVTVQTFVKAEGQRLRLLARVPIASLKVTTWPLKAPDILDTSRATEELTNAAKRSLADQATMFEGSRTLPAPQVVSVRATLPTDQSFQSYDQALALLTGPSAPITEDIPITTGFLDVMFEYPIESETSRFSIEPRWGAGLGKQPLTVIRLITPQGAIRAYELPGNPGFVQLDPEWYQAASRFVALGFEHILSGTDHLLFLFALVIPFRRIRQLLVVVTAFTVAHSITLIASAYDFAPQSSWFPPIIETLIAASIVYMTLENMMGVKNLQRRWMITFGFGLVHGFGFSFALKQTLQLAGAHLLTSLLSFNVGVELGQLLVLAICVPGLALAFRYIPERIGAVFFSALVAHTGWHWLLERASILRRYPFRLALTREFLVAELRWAAVILAIAGALWLISVLTRARARRRPESLEA